VNAIGGRLMVTRMAALQVEQMCETQRQFLSVDFGRSTHTVQQAQPNAANPNTTESMLKNAHRTLDGPTLNESPRSPAPAAMCNREIVVSVL
jgi:hypothetical protein